MRINTKPRRQNSHRADEERRCEPHKQWIRGRRCLTEGQGCGGKIECAHVDHAGGKGMSLKVSDFASVPLCENHHREYHRGARTFEAAHSVDMVAAAAAYAAKSPHRLKHERKLADRRATCA